MLATVCDMIHGSADGEDAESTPRIENMTKIPAKKTRHVRVAGGNSNLGRQEETTAE
jgi:hypothetical protein